MTKVQKYKQAKAVINDIPNYMEYQPTKEQNEALDIVLDLLNEAIEKATVPCFNGYKCPFCGHEIHVTEQFLPKVTECESCGADMRGGDPND